jgi:hypothetical protein
MKQVCMRGRVWDDMRAVQNVIALLAAALENVTEAADDDGVIKFGVLRRRFRSDEERSGGMSKERMDALAQLKRAQFELAKVAEDSMLAGAAAGLLTAVEAAVAVVEEFPKREVV